MSFFILSRKLFRCISDSFTVRFAFWVIRYFAAVKIHLVEFSVYGLPDVRFFLRELTSYLQKKTINVILLRLFIFAAFIRWSDGWAEINFLRNSLLKSMVHWMKNFCFTFSLSHIVARLFCFFTAFDFTYLLRRRSIFLAQELLKAVWATIHRKIASSNHMQGEWDFSIVLDFTWVYF